MTDKRATKSGYALEASRKLSAKYDSSRAKVALEWVFQSIGDELPADYNGSSETTVSLLKSGVVLAKLANYIEVGTVKSKLLEKTSEMPFKQMELINLFLAMITKKGYVKETEVFQTVDLYEAQNVNMVIITIEALGRGMLSKGLKGFGKAESHGHVREWTEEQLKEGQSIIGLQMGSNKGANQSGLNIGKSRSIMD